MRSNVKYEININSVCSGQWRLNRWKKYLEIWKKKFTKSLSQSVPHLPTLCLEIRSLHVITSMLKETVEDQLFFTITLTSASVKYTYQCLFLPSCDPRHSHCFDSIQSVENRTAKDRANGAIRSKL